ILSFYSNLFAYELITLVAFLVHMLKQVVACVIFWRLLSFYSFGKHLPVIFSAFATAVKARK
ncbi:hypothetical protein CG405_03910, partial [Gardnerella vaginalis]